MDSGAPCAFPRGGIEPGDVVFIFGWLLTATATELLRTVLNHTRNIQSKDVERLPYPWWVDATTKTAAAGTVEELLSGARSGTHFALGDPKLASLEDFYRKR